MSESLNWKSRIWETEVYPVVAVGPCIVYFVVVRYGLRSGTPYWTLLHVHVHTAAPTGLFCRIKGRSSSPITSDPVLFAEASISMKFRSVWLILALLLELVLLKFFCAHINPELSIRIGCFWAEFTINFFGRRHRNCRAANWNKSVPIPYFLPSRVSGRFDNIIFKSTLDSISVQNRRPNMVWFILRTLIIG